MNNIATHQMKKYVNTVQFPALDDYILTGTLYSPPKPKAQILVASATGVPQTFYRRFAEYAMQAGYQVLCFDYRGVAQSAPKSLKGFEMSYLDWGRLDLSGAINYLKQEALDLFMVGHSYGGQSLGLASNHQHIKAMYCFGTGAGWHGYMPLKERIKVQIVWNIVFPPMVAHSGYLAWSKVNMGADLPKGVYTEWKKWCKNPTYFFGDPDQKYLFDLYAQVKTPIFAVAALDDAWALPKSRHAFMQHYSKTTVQYIDITAKQYGLKEIGHMGYFRKGSEKIWQSMINTFDEMCLA